MVTLSYVSIRHATCIKKKSMPQIYRTSLTPITSFPAFFELTRSADRTPRSIHIFSQDQNQNPRHWNSILNTCTNEKQNSCTFYLTTTPTPNPQTAGRIWFKIATKIAKTLFSKKNFKTIFFDIYCPIFAEEIRKISFILRGLRL